MFNSLSLNIFSLVLCVIAALATECSSEHPIVKLRSVKIVGVPDVNGTQEFFGGIPFAEPPVGNLRFRPPQPKTTWNGNTFNATTLASAMCMQDLSFLGGLGQLPGVVIPISEDCLMINVARPAGTKSHSKLPVMAWIYGGGFNDGGTLIYNGSTIVAQGVTRGTPIIYVNFNYRLGVLGFPVGDEAANEDVLNLGLKDQKLALQWIQKNIGAFGGDRDKVTVFGESAGAMSISMHMLNPSFASLAHGAILQSGSASSSPLFEATTEGRNTGWRNFLRAVPECEQFANMSLVSDDALDGSGFTDELTSSLECLRNVENATAIVRASTIASSQSTGGNVFGPTLDFGSGDAVIPTLPSRAYSQGSFAKIPFIAGANKDEGTGSRFSRTANFTAEEIRQLLIRSVTPSELEQDELELVIDRVLELYPDDPALGSPYDTGNEAFGLSSGHKRWSSISGDKNFQAGRRLLNRIPSGKKDSVKSWGYLFTDPQANPSTGVGHGAEVPYIHVNLLRNTTTSRLLPNFPKDLASAFELSDTMVDYWISFAVGLDPNDGKGNERPVWNAYGCEHPTVLQLQNGNTSNIADGFREEMMDVFLDNPVAFRK